MKRQLLIYLFFISVFSLYSSNVRFNNINNIYGTSIRETVSVCKDGNGFIWVSSRSCIMRLENDNYRIYYLPLKIPNVITIKLIYRNKSLIAYSNNGQIFKYNDIYDRFDYLLNVRECSHHPELGLNNLLIDNQGNYLISTNCGLWKYRVKDSSITQLKSNDFQYITWFDSLQVVAATKDQISLINTCSLQEKSIYKYPSNHSLDVSKLFFDQVHKRLWVGTLCDGLFYYDFISSSSLVKLPIKGFPQQPILAIETDRDSSVLIGIDGQGIWKIDKHANKVIAVYKENMDDPSSLPGNGVYDIFRDKESGRTWICSVTGGASFFEQSSPAITRIKHQINKSNSLNNNHVNQIIEDHLGNLWFATDNGISYWNRTSNKWKTFFQNGREQAHVFLSLCEDKEGRIWCGSYSSGIYIIDGETGVKLAHYSKKKIGIIPKFNFVFEIYCDSAGDVWIGSNSGPVYCYLSKEKKFRKYPSLTVSAFTEWTPEKVLVACSDGLTLINKKTGNSHTLLNGDMFQDLFLESNKVWLASSGNGLSCFDLKTKDLKTFKIGSGLPSNYVNSLVYTSNCLWLGTETGLCQFNLKIKAVTNLLSSLSDASFNRNAHCMLRDGKLIWGTNNGAIILNPSSIKQSESKGNIFIQDILVSGRSIRDNNAFKLKVPLDKMQKITLPYDQNNLTIEFLPTGVNASKFKFSWGMEGVDQMQSYSSNYGKLIYTNIPIGTYDLKLRMYDKFSSKLIAERLFLVHIIPPFWKTWWFLFSLFILLAAASYFIFRFYINRLKQRHTEDKVRFFTNMAHEIRTTLTLIKAPIEELRKKDLPESDKYYLNLAGEQARRLSSTVTHLLDFQKVDIGKGQLSLEMVDIVKLVENRIIMFESLARSKNNEMLFAAMPKVYLTAVDVLKIERVVDNLISNAIKYSHVASPVRITFIGTKKNWTLNVEDHGIGISKKAQRKIFQEFYRSENAINSNNIGSGIGLLLAKDYVTLHEGKIHCISQENKGSSFEITIPFRRAIDNGFKKHGNTTVQLTHDNNEYSEYISLSKMRLLIIEDYEELRNFMYAALSSEFEVSMEKDGESAWKAILTQMPDIVISDVVMPKMDGFELCRMIKSTYETSHIPVVLLTALTEKAEQLHGLGLGADNYLTKPFDMALVTQCLRSIVQNRAIVREKALKFIGNNKETLFKNELNDKFMKKAIEVIKSNMLNTEFSNKEFASTMNISEPLLYKKIKALTAQTPLELIKIIRLNHALELLQTREYTITEISEMCGFSSLSYFGKAFKKHFGKLPSEV